MHSYNTIREVNYNVKAHKDEPNNLTEGDG